MNALKIVILANDTTYTYNLRREIIAHHIASGHTVIVVCRFLKLKDELEALGCRLINLPIGSQGTNPVEDVWLFFRYLHILRKEKPDVVLSYNIKPNVYGGMACRLLGIKYLPNITGLGTAVEYPGRLQMFTTRLYKAGVSNAACVLFQNEENEHFFWEHNMLSRHSRTRLLPGSGVNLDVHESMPYPEGDIVHFLFIARIMKEKGIDLYMAAAKEIWGRHKNVLFHICGYCDDEKYLGILKEAENSGYLKYHGEQKELLPFYRMANCIVHPSYYPEGMSNVLLEAAASARPIITTNRNGCRECVDDGRSGYVVPVKEEGALIEAIEKFLTLSWEEKRDMGLNGRIKMECEFDRNIVVRAYAEETERIAASI